MDAPHFSEEINDHICKLRNTLREKLKGNSMYDPTHFHKKII